MFTTQRISVFRITTQRRPSPIGEIGNVCALHNYGWQVGRLGSCGTDSVSQDAGSPSTLRKAIIDRRIHRQVDDRLGCSRPDPGGCVRRLCCHFSHTQGQSSCKKKDHRNVILARRHRKYTADIRQPAVTTLLLRTIVRGFSSPPNNHITKAACWRTFRLTDSLQQRQTIEYSLCPFSLRYSPR